MFSSACAVEPGLCTLLTAYALGAVTAGYAAPPIEALDGSSGAHAASFGLVVDHVGVFSSPRPSGIIILAAQSALPVGECVGGIGFCGG